MVLNIDTGSALSVNEQKNLGDASVINNGLLTISTERSSQRLSRRADKMCFQIDLSSLKDKTYNIPLSG